MENSSATVEKNESRKKIVVVVPEFPVTTETFIQRDILKLVTRGNVDVDVFALKKGDGEVAPGLVKRVYYKRLGIFELLTAAFTIITNPAPFFRFARELTEEGYTNKIKNYYLVFKAYGYTRILRNHGPDELHIHFFSDFSTLFMFSSILLDIPFSLNVHARDVLEYPHLPEKKIKACKFTSVCNENAYKKLLELAPESKEKIVMLHHLVDRELLFENIERTKKEEVPTIFMGGTRLTEKKGIEFMIEASKILINQGFNHRVILIGPGPLAGELAKLINSNNLSANFYLKSEAVPFTDLIPYFFSSQLFVLPNIETDYGDADGIPNVLIEAALAELPIITTNAGSNLELVEDGVTGYIVEQKNAKALADKIRYVLENDQTKVKAVAISARQKAETLFSEDRTVAKLEEMLLK